MIDKLMGAFVTVMKSKALKTSGEEPKEELKDELKDEPKDEPKVVLDPVLVSQWEVALEKFVYDPELAKELAPVFVSLLSVEGFDKVIELLETKEKQIEAISSGCNQQSSPDQKQEPQEVKPQTATDILKARHQQS